MPLTLIVLLMLSALVAFVLAALVLQGARHKAERMSFALFTGSMGAWAFFVGLFLMTDNATVALWAAKLYYISAAIMIYGLLAFRWRIPSSSEHALGRRRCMSYWRSRYFV
jgi:hypothetical protein